LNENDIIIKRKIGICRRTGMDTIKKKGKYLSKQQKKTDEA
jgi:hypothetical protein